MLVIGIDPGISGSLCLFQDGKIIDVVEMPTMIQGKKNKPCCRLSADTSSDTNIFCTLQSPFCFNRNEARSVFWVDKRFVGTRSNKYF